MPCDDDVRCFLDLVCFADFFTVITRRDHLVVDDKERRRKKHGQGDNQQEDICDRGRDNVARDREGQEHEAKLTRLCKAKRKEPFVGSLDLEYVCEDEEDNRFDRDQAQRHRNDRADILEQQRKVDACANAHEE